jgi:hypothetical protein
MRATWPAHHTLLGSITIIVYAEENKL